MIETATLSAIADHVLGQTVLADLAGFSRLSDEIMASGSTQAAEDLTLIVEGGLSALASHYQFAGFKITEMLGDALLFERKAQNRPLLSQVDLAQIATSAAQSLANVDPRLKVRISASDGLPNLQTIELNGRQLSFKTGRVVETLHQTIRATPILDGDSQANGRAIPPKIKLDPQAAGIVENVSFSFLALPIEATDRTRDKVMSALKLADNFAARFGGILVKIGHDDEGLLVRFEFRRLDKSGNTHETNALNFKEILSSDLRKKGLPGAVSVSSGLSFKHAVSFGDRVWETIHGAVINRGAKAAKSMLAEGQPCPQPDTSNQPEHILHLGQKRFRPPAQEFGREIERAQILNWLAVERPAVEKRDFALLIEGPAGIGKSTLVDEIVQAHSSTCCKIIFEPGDFLENNAVWTKLVPHLFFLATQSHNQEPWAEWLSNWFTPFEVSSILVEFSGQKDAAKAEDTTELASLKARIVQRLTIEVSAASSEPILVFLDDVQWMDAGSVALLDALFFMKSPLRILATKRAEVHLSANSFLSQGERIFLKPFEPRDSRRLLSKLVEPIIEAEMSFLVDEILAVSNGSPFAISQFASLLNTGWRGEVWPEDTGNLPDALIAMRLEGIPPRPRMLLRALAVANRPMTLIALHSVADLPIADVAFIVDELQRTNLIRGNMDDRVRLEHRLIRDAVYSRIPPTPLRLMHRRCGRSLARDKASWAEIGFHWARSGSVGRAHIYYRRAAEASNSVGAYELVPPLVDEAIQLVSPKLPLPVLTLASAKITALWRQGRLADLRAAITSFEITAKKIENSPRPGAAARRANNTIASAKALVEVIAGELALFDGKIGGLIVRAVVARMIRWFRPTLAEDPGSLNLIAVVAAMTGLETLSLRWQKMAIGAASTAAGECHAIYTSAVANAAMGRFDQAIQQVSQSRALAEETGNAPAAEISMMIAAFCELSRGNFDLSLHAATDTRVSALARGSGFYDGTAQAVIAFMQAWNGQAVQALAQCTSSEQALSNDIDGVCPLLLAGARSIAFSCLGQTDAALSQCLHGVELARHIRPTHMGMFGGHLGVAYVLVSLAATGSARARSAVGEALSQLDRFSWVFKFAKPFAKQLRANWNKLSTSKASISLRTSPFSSHMGSYAVAPPIQPFKGD